MPRSRVSTLAWVVATSFVVATLLQYVDRLNLVATPPELPTSNMVQHAIATQPYRQAIWPVFLWTNLLFGIGFAAAVAFAASVAAASGRPGGLPTFRSLATVGGVIAAIASIIPLGAVNAAVWLGYCDCGFKETEIVSQIWAGMVAQDIADWFNRFAGVVLAVALVSLVRDDDRLLTPLLRTWTWITALALVAGPVVATIELGPPELLDVIFTAIGLVLIPVWAVWLGRSVDSMGRATADA